MTASATFAAIRADYARLPSTLDLAEIYFDHFGAGSIGATCTHLLGAVMREFPGTTIEKLRPIADRLAAERADARVFEPGNDYDHPWYLIIGTAPANRKLTGADILTTMAEDFGSHSAHQVDLTRHVQRRVRCSAYRVSLVCRELAAQGRGRIVGDIAEDGTGSWAFRTR